MHNADIKFRIPELEKTFYLKRPFENKTGKNLALFWKNCFWNFCWNIGIP